MVEISPKWIWFYKISTYILTILELTWVWSRSKWVDNRWSTGLFQTTSWTSKLKGQVIMGILLLFLSSSSSKSISCWLFQVITPHFRGKIYESFLKDFSIWKCQTSIFWTLQMSLLLQSRVSCKTFQFFKGESYLVKAVLI